MTAAPLFEAHDLQAWYGSSHSLRGVHLQLAPGQTLGLLGRNGMGKSTLLRTVLGHVRQRSGQIRIAGQDLSRGHPHEAARLGVAYVPEGRSVFPNLSVRENLMMAAGPGPQDRDEWTFKRVMAVFPRLSERLTDLGAQLSGGEQQMLSIGRALMTNPLVVSLDEATEGLAPLIVNDIWRVIALISDSGIATIVVDRDYRRVLAHADQAMVKQRGLSVLAGPANRVASDPALNHLLGV